MEYNPIFDVSEVMETAGYDSVKKLHNNGWILLNTYVHRYDIGGNQIREEMMYVLGKIK